MCARALSGINCLFIFIYFFFSHSLFFFSGFSFKLEGQTRSFDWKKTLRLMMHKCACVCAFIVVVVVVSLVIFFCMKYISKWCTWMYCILCDVFFFHYSSHFDLFIYLFLLMIHKWNRLHSFLLFCFVLLCAYAFFMYLSVQFSVFYIVSIFLWVVFSPFVWHLIDVI